MKRKSSKRHSKTTIHVTGVLCRMISYQGIYDKSVVYPSVKPNGGGIVTCITYDPPIVDLPVGSKNKVCNNPTKFNLFS